MKRLNLIIIMVFILAISGLSISILNSDASLTDSNMSQDTESNTLTGASVAMIVERFPLGDESQTIILKKIDKVMFNVGEESHTAQIRRIYSDYLIINVNSFAGIDVNLYLNKTEKVDVNADEVYDLAMTLHEIISINLVNITFEKITESTIAIPEEIIPEPEPLPEEIIAELPVEEAAPIAEPIIEEPPEPKSKAWVWIIGIIAIAVIIYVIFCPKKKLCQKRKVRQKKKQ